MKTHAELVEPVAAALEGRVPNKTIINEKECTINLQGMKFTASGAYLDEERGIVYLGDCTAHPGLCKRSMYNHSGEITSWHGETLGRYETTGVWNKFSPYLGRTYWWSVRVTIYGTPPRHYFGRVCVDTSQAVKIRRYKEELTCS